MSIIHRATSVRRCSSPRNVLHRMSNRPFSQPPQRVAQQRLKLCNTLSLCKYSHIILKSSDRFQPQCYCFLVSILLMHGEYFAGKFVAGGSGILFWSIFFFEMIKSEVRFVILVKFWSYLIPRTIILFYRCKKIKLKKLFTFINLCHNIYQFPPLFKQCRRNTRFTI